MKNRLKFVVAAATIALAAISTSASATVTRNGITYNNCSGSSCTVRACYGDYCVVRTDYFVMDASGNWNFVSSTEQIVRTTNVLE